MSTLNSLPHATQQQMNAMEKKAQEMMQRDGVIPEPVAAEPIENKHPMLQHHEEPTMQFDQEDAQLPEQYEEYDSEPEIKHVESSKEINFRTLRERAERAERERDEAMKYAMSFNQPKQQASIKQSEPEDDYSDIGLDDDSLAEGKHLKKMMKEMREIKKELNSYKSQSLSDTVELKLKSQYPDMNSVLTTDNLQALSNMNPDLADMISQTPDLYKRAKLAYDMVKQLGIYKDRSYDAEKAQAQKNASKPRPLTSVSPQQGDSPLSKANAFVNGPLTKEYKDQLNKEMLAAIKNGGR